MSSSQSKIINDIITRFLRIQVDNEKMRKMITKLNVIMNEKRMKTYQGVSGPTMKAKFHFHHA